MLLDDLPKPFKFDLKKICPDKSVQVNRSIFSDSLYFLFPKNRKLIKKFFTLN